VPPGVCLAEPASCRVPAWSSSPRATACLPGRPPPCHPTKTDRRAGAPGTRSRGDVRGAERIPSTCRRLRERSLSSPPVHLAETLTHTIRPGHTARNTISQCVSRAGMRTSTDLQPSPGGTDNAQHDHVNTAARGLRPRMHAGLSSSSSSRPRTDTVLAVESHPHPREGAVTQKARRREVPDASTPTAAGNRARRDPLRERPQSRALDSTCPTESVHGPSATPWRTRRAAPDRTRPEPLRDAAAVRVTTGVRSAPPRTTRTRRGP
jgi:hypothetical protein